MQLNYEQVSVDFSIKIADKNVNLQTYVIKGRSPLVVDHEFKKYCKNLHDDCVIFYFHKTELVGVTFFFYTPRCCFFIVIKFILFL